MCKTTKGSQTAASQEPVRSARRSGASGGVPEPANAFRGKPERVPQIVFIRERSGDGFLTSAKTYYELFGLNVRMVDSVAEIVSIMAQPGSVYQRLAIVNHANPRGMIIPFFTGGVRGTNKEAFREFAKSDLEGLKLFSPFPSASGHLFDWDSIMSSLMGLLRTRNSAALQPFGFDTSGSPPTGSNLREFFKFSFDIVYLRNPGRVRRNDATSSGINASQRTILENFVLEILNQMRPGLVSSLSVTSTQVNTLRSTITSLTYADMTTVANLGNFHPHLDLEDDSMNDFPTLQAMVPAIQGGFRTQLNAARQRINASTLIDIRGCRAGEDEDYLEALREFFGTGAQKPTVTAPRWFQAFPKIAFQPPANRANIASWIGAAHWGHTSAQLKEAFRNWADLIRVRPLHVDFWLLLLRGQAVRFGALAWRSQIPALFIPTPGLADLNGLDFAQVIGKLKDYFNVPNAAVPNASTLTSLVPVTSNLAAWSVYLLTPAPDSATSVQRTTIFQNLQQINTALSQSLVPTSSPNAPDPPTSAQIRGYQTALVGFLENTLTPIKNFMTAAADSLETGDGLHFYLLFAGLPVFVHGIPELNKNGLVVLHGHRAVALQSWYKCLWKDPLPATGPYTSATIETIDHRQVVGLVGADRTSFLSICPIPKYMNCIRKRPMPSGEDESLCG